LAISENLQPIAALLKLCAASAVTFVDYPALWALVEVQLA